MGKSIIALCATWFLCGAPAQAQDEAWLLGLEGSAMLPVTAPQTQLFGPGASLGVSLHRSVFDWLAIGASVRAGLLSDGAAPADPTLADPGIGDLYTLALGVRLRPLSWLFGPERGTGLWLDGRGGAALTGGRIRPTVEAALGWGFALGDVDLSPFVRWQGVFETENQIDSRPANLVSFGVEVAFFDQRTRPAPIGDTDGDGLRDDVDACVTEPEDHDEFQDDDGCPEQDNDGDGIYDAQDQCPMVAEDADGWEDEDGCPDPDNDGDQILDPQDQCPNEREVLNGIDDQDGCPDEGLIEMIDDRIVLPERVLFDYEQSHVHHRALPVLRAIANLFAQHPEWSRIRIEGHTDSRGSDEFNQALSERRAAAVRDAMVRVGVEVQVLDTVGYGESQPRVSGEDEASYEENRRVEFIVAARMAHVPGASQ